MNTKHNLLVFFFCWNTKSLTLLLLLYSIKNFLDKQTEPRKTTNKPPKNKFSWQTNLRKQANRSYFILKLALPVLSCLLVCNLRESARYLLMKLTKSITATKVVTWWNGNEINGKINHHTLCITRFLHILKLAQHLVDDLKCAWTSGFRWLLELLGSGTCNTNKAGIGINH